MIIVTQDGQITIPKHLRDDLGIEEGQKYALRILEGGILVLMPQSGKATMALAQLRQFLIKQGASQEERQTELRRMREAKEE